MAEPGTPKLVFNILLVEDNAAQASLIKKRLAQSSSPSFIVRYAASLESAFEFVLTPPDAILLDLSLPDSQGLNTFLQMREHAQETPIIILTALDNEAMGLEAVRRGAQDYLVKGKTNFEEIPRILRYAIERNKTQVELRQWSMTDELTGLHNRRGFYFLADQEVKNATRAKKNLLLTFLDLDGLKKINDTHGHEAGDQAIRAVSDLLKQTFRQSDVIARLGGDEFAVLSMESSPEAAQTLSTRLEQSMSLFQARFPFCFSCSWGMALYSSERPVSLEDLIAEADRQMYLNKKSKESLTEPGAWLETETIKGSENKVILIVEDEAGIRKMLQRRLAQAGFEVHAASDGEEGLAEARKIHPDLVLLDLRLPKLPGEEVCKAIREDQDKRFAKTPIIMLTAKTSDVDRVIGNVIGATLYMTKPFDGEHLLREIRRLLRLPKKKEAV